MILVNGGFEFSKQFLGVKAELDRNGRTDWADWADWAELNGFFLVVLLRGTHVSQKKRVHAALRKPLKINVGAKGFEPLTLSV